VAPKSVAPPAGRLLIPTPAFSSIVGRLAANHVLTLVAGNENLRPLGELTLWKGVQEIVFSQG
jgi:hypothetical protein